MTSIIKSTSDITITLITAVFIYLAAMDGVIFYYKYTNALDPKAASTEAEVRFYLDNYKKELEDIIDSSSQISDKIVAYDQINDKFGEYLSKSAVSDVYLLKASDGGNMSVISSYDKSMIGEDASFPECGINTSSDILKLAKGGMYFYKQVLPENHVFVCAFEPVRGYMLGIKNTFNKSLKGFSDPDFKDWFVQNLSLTLIASIIGVLLSVSGYFWILNRYLKQQRSFEKTKKEDDEKIRISNTMLYLDDATGLLNRRALDRDLSNFKYPRIVIISIDDFNSMQEYYGDEICDTVLAKMAEVLKELAKEHKMNAYRIEYDKFCLMENTYIVSLDDYEELAQMIIDRFKGRIINIEKDDLKAEEIEVNTTIGMSLDDTHTLLKAYIALKYATKNRKDFACFFKGLSNPDEYIHQIKYSSMIKNAILNNTISHFYQPIFDANKELLRYELLVRLDDSNEPVPPMEFLLVARKIKRYEDLQRSMIEQLKADMLEKTGLSFSINLNIDDLFLQNISNDILSLAEIEGVGKRLFIELVLNDKISDMPRLLNFTNRLKSRGAHIVLDDFAGEYGMSLWDMALLKPEIIKISSVVTRNIDTELQSKDMLGSIIKFAHSSGIRVAVKHIHSKDVFEACKSLGADEYQGFYLGLASNGMQEKKYGLN
ncbi:EAL domain-containing protein [Campylobacter sp. 19-13652]|uniref:EAL domain-containing protein n=1 Tax=Campylobacter sp. 19-13652 TaxID=2840180 RepID=UPI001C78F5B1|nr:EAL domain-containing protein [Campylobacter sp. 19-13652]BCX80017.1 hypothetical protein LBC_14790 [Campylobacter sp. 19-13652]